MRNIQNAINLPSGEVAAHRNRLLVPSPLPSGPCNAEKEDRLNLCGLFVKLALEEHWIKATTPNSPLSLVLTRIPHDLSPLARPSWKSPRLPTLSAQCSVSGPHSLSTLLSIPSVIIPAFPLAHHPCHVPQATPLST
ncbi:hypothetical protein NMY22_g19527 [Coprinellus aureogranulatus]|nr:hypothetical protein NMY22_g19527 [Coprinellus aureogranulatus]